jgi:hypothetical protein
MNALKSRLLTAMILAPITIKIFGDEYQIKRLSAARLAKHDKSINAARTAQDGDALAKAHAQLVLDSLIDGDGVAADSTKPSELMEVHDNLSLVEAASTVIKANFGMDGALEEAKNA